MHSLVAVIGLLDEGGTVPFIARYRKEATGNLDEVQIRSIEEKLAYFRELESRRETILASIQEQGKLTDELKARIEATLDRASWKICIFLTSPSAGPRRQSRAKRDLEPLAEYLWEQQHTGVAARDIRRDFRQRGVGVASVEEALEGARHIVAEMDQRRRRSAQVAPQVDVRRRHRRQPQSASTPSTSRKSSRCTTSTASP